LCYYRASVCGCVCKIIFKEFYFIKVQQAAAVVGVLPTTIKIVKLKMVQFRWRGRQQKQKLLVGDQQQRAADVGP
jgi:hypothetical protein